MSKRKLLIHEVFEQAKRESQKDTKSGLAFYLWGRLEDNHDFKISEKTLIRYYEAFIENNSDVNIEPYKLDKLSQYIGYDDFKDFNYTYEKKIEGEGENTTSVKFLLDGEEVSVPEKIFNIIIKITNNPNFNVPDFMKKNGLGVLEFVFVALLVTGGVVFSNPIDKNNRNTFGFMNSKFDTEKSYMYWNGEEYIGTDSSYISPEFKVVAMDKQQHKYLRRITRKDTMTVDNSLGKTWYSKYNGEVEFFTNDGIDPDNGRELKKSTSFMIEKYAGKNIDSIQVAE
ncbi:hypothetical protein J3D55_000497 [Chryseobacterium ginsenosidimutans]|uniref:hypothetical protein n=1 Tax=Chryseobacterium ginsenosidimutans TaxID=687846 RepID=UPI002169EC60|nr:hypothetical protein [Chryseobacterium ginsenosidimutans]MCS3867581.1 hypothetical protein [Chryseobacterium ginsenosidimutans]